MSLLKTMVQVLLSVLSDAEVPLQPGGLRNDGIAPGNQRWPVAPCRRWKNHNLRQLRYLVNQDLDNIVWWYWLDDGDDDIPLWPVQNPNICIWAARCRLYGPDTKEIINYSSVECRIRHEFDLWTRSFRPVVEYAVSRTNIRM
jgi:hypothetical protein